MIRDELSHLVVWSSCQTMTETAIKSNEREAAQLYRRGVAAARGGQRRVAAGLLSRAVQLNPRHELGWLWLSGVLDAPDEIAFCLRSALAYVPAGRVPDADVSAAGNPVTESYVSAVIDQSAELDPEQKATLRDGRAQVMQTGRPVEHYRRVSLDTARGLLAAEPGIL